MLKKKTDTHPTLKAIAEIPEQASIAIYGTGRFGEDFFRAVNRNRPDVTISFWIDSYKRGEKMGLPIVTPDLLASMSDTYEFIFIASSFTEQILSNNLSRVAGKSIMPVSDGLLTDVILKDVFNPGRYPSFQLAGVELTSLCNMDCSFCPRRTMKRPQKHMDFNFFTVLVDEIVELGLARIVQLFGLGEPLLYPRLDEAVAYCKAKGLQTSLATNGLLLTPERYRKLVESGLDYLLISLHNLSSRSFSLRHPKPNIGFDAYFENVLSCVDLHLEAKPSTTLAISLMFSKKQWMSDILWDLPEVRKDTEEAEALLDLFMAKVHALANRHSLPLYLQEDELLAELDGLEENGTRIFRLMDNLNLEMRAMQHYEMLTARQKLEEGLKKNFVLVKSATGTCHMINSFTISADGSFIPCCRDNLAEIIPHKVGRGTSIKDILESREYLSLLDGFRRNKLTHPTCRECKGQYAAVQPVEG